MSQTSMTQCLRKSRRQRGFSLIELMITLIVLTIIMAAIFQQIDLVQQRSFVEQTKLDMFQEAREFMDQMQRDLHQAGYPNQRNFGTGILTVSAARPSSPYSNDSRVAAGLTKVDVGDLWFEGDVDGTGTVSVVHYHLQSTGTGCPCLMRSHAAKISGDPLTGQSTPTYDVEIQNVQNGSSTNPIFYAYAHNAGGTASTLPLDFNANSSALAGIDTIMVVLTVQSTVPDPKTRLFPITTLVSTVKLNNCSSAYTGQYLSCN